MAVVDLDGDGRLDVIVESLQGLRVIRNTSPAKRFARVRLKATKTERHALGARVVVEAAGVKQQDLVKMTDGFQTQVPTDLHFGLADAAKIDKLTVTWPSGATRTFADLPVDRLISIVEGSDTPEVSELPRWPDATLPREARAFSLALEAQRLDGGAREPLATKGKPAVVNFWGPSCLPCGRELPALKKVAEKHANVQFVGVNVEVDQLDKARATIAQQGYRQLVANDDVVKSFFGGNPEIVLPSTFVFDANGDVARTFGREVGEAELSALLDSFGKEGVLAPDLALRGLVAFDRGEFAEAVEWYRRAIAARPDVGRYHNNLGAALGALGKHAEAAVEFDAVVKLDPDNADAWFNLGAAKHASGNAREAIACFEKALALRGEHVRTLLALTLTAEKAGDLDKALAACERAVKADARSPSARFALGRVHAARGDKAKAIEAWRATLEIDPGFEPAMKALASQAP